MRSAAWHRHGCRRAQPAVVLDLVDMWAEHDDDVRNVVLFALDALADGSLRPGVAWQRYRSEVAGMLPLLRAGAMTPQQVHITALDLIGG